MKNKQQFFDHLLIDKEQGQTTIMKIMSSMQEKEDTIAIQANKFITTTQTTRMANNIYRPQELSYHTIQKAKTEKLRRKRNKKIEIVKNNSLQHQRIDNICNNFLKKIQRNNIYRATSFSQQILSEEEEHNFSAFQVSNMLRQFWDSYGSFTMIFAFFYQTFCIAFTTGQLSYLSHVHYLLSLVFFCGQIAFNVLTVKKFRGKKIIQYKEIIKQYLLSYFFIDFSLLILTNVSYFQQTDDTFHYLITSFYFFKIENLMEKFKRIQSKIFKTFHYQRYWSLVKIIIFNLIFAHAIAIILNIMIKGSPESNWQTIKKINNQSISVKYTWSYYWATTIMLTVGFGDIVPSNSTQALWIIFIEISSCIAFSYNISCLGGIITEIRCQGESISNNRKIFQNLSQKSNFSQDLNDKILSYIDQSVKIKTNFNLDQEKQFINSLPEGYKKQVRCQTNKNMLKQIPFFTLLKQKTIFEMSGFIERIISFPEEIVKPINSQFKIFILEKGQIAYSFKKPRSKKNGKKVNLVNVKDTDKPFLLNFDFITLIRPSFQIKSVDYSIINCLKYENFVQSLRNYGRDYEYYCLLKDRSKHIVDEYQTVICTQCKVKHTYFSCPKLHFRPSQQHIILRELLKPKLEKNVRVDYKKRRQSGFFTLLNYYYLTQQYSKFIQIYSLSELISSKEFNSQNSSTGLQQVNSDLKNLITSNLSTDIIKDTIQTQVAEDFYVTVSDMIIGAINKQLKLGNQRYEDEIWTLDLDKLQQFKIYFPLDNIKSICKKINKICIKRKYDKIHTETCSEQYNKQSIHKRIK